MCKPAIVGWPALVAAHTFAGLALGQYCHYTARVYDDCWADECVPVLGIMLFAGALVGFFSCLVAIVLPPPIRVPVLTVMCASLLMLPRAAVPLIGSLFDGNAKAARRQE